MIELAIVYLKRNYSYHERLGHTCPVVVVKGDNIFNEVDCSSKKAKENEIIKKFNPCRNWYFHGSIIFVTETEVNYTYSKTNFHFVDHWEMTLIFVQIYPINLLGLGPNLPFSN